MHDIPHKMILHLVGQLCFVLLLHSPKNIRLLLCLWLVLLLASLGVCVDVLVVQSDTLVGARKEWQVQAPFEVHFPKSCFKDTSLLVR